MQIKMGLDRIKGAVCGGLAPFVQAGAGLTNRGRNMYDKTTGRMKLAVGALAAAPIVLGAQAAVAASPEECKSAAWGYFFGSGEPISAWLGYKICTGELTGLGAVAAAIVIGPAALWFFWLRGND